MRSSGERDGWGAGNPASTGSGHAEDRTKSSPVTFYHPSGEGRSQSKNRHATDKPMVKVGEIQLCMVQVNPRAGWWGKRNRTQQMTTSDRGWPSFQWLRNQGWFTPNEETLFSQGLSLSIKAKISSRLNRKELASCITWLERTEACGFPAG